jgi:uncharacterized protein
MHYKNPARMTSGLPYRYSKLHRSAGRYSGHNPGYGDEFRVEYRIGEYLKHKSALDRWLTERYALFLPDGDTIHHFDIHHVEWPVHAIGCDVVTVNYARFSPLIHNHPDAMHYSPGVKVVAWSSSATA